MRGLAEFVMTGRKQAIMAVLLLGLIPLVNLLNPVVVGLVMLRKGVSEASIILAWAILPVGGWAIAGDIVPLIMLIGISGLSLLLRETESWEFTLLAAIAIGIAVEIYLRVRPAMLDLMFQQLGPYLDSNNLQGMQIEEFRELVTSFIGSVYMFLAVVLLMLARWMQAVLYNPGGFKQEFHQLRIKQTVALGLMALTLLANFDIVIPSGWVLYLVLPMLFSGVALVHAVVAKKQMSGMWLVVFYAVIMFPLAVQIVVLLALIDSWYDFRTRIKTPV
jgi:hypothetical protein